jgi:hypothetical protein
VKKEKRVLAEKKELRVKKEQLGRLGNKVQRVKLEKKENKV